MKRRVKNSARKLPIFMICYLRLNLGTSPPYTTAVITSPAHKKKHEPLGKTILEREETTREEKEKTAPSRRTCIFLCVVRNENAKCGVRTRSPYLKLINEIENERDRKRKKKSKTTKREMMMNLKLQLET